jgi:hypothetical protein
MPRLDAHADAPSRVDADRAAARVHQMHVRSLRADA